MLIESGASCEPKDSGFFQPSVKARAGAYTAMGTLFGFHNRKSKRFLNLRALMLSGWEQEK